LGGFHDKVTLDPVISSYSSGASGGEGRSETQQITLDISLIFNIIFIGGMCESFHDSHVKNTAHLNLCIPQNKILPAYLYMIKKLNLLIHSQIIF
jgi:hypothetical protein